MYYQRPNDRIIRQRMRSRFSLCSTLAAMLLATFDQSFGFHQPNPFFSAIKSAKQSRHIALFSSVGDGPPSSGKDNDEFGDIDKFLDPTYKESENLIKAREYMSENSLPLSYDNADATVNADATPREATDKLNATASNELMQSSAVVGNESESGGAMVQNAAPLTQESLANNPYMAVVSRLSPNELISRFTSTAHPRVQSAVRQTVLGLIGGLPKMAFDTTTVMSGQRLASLMFQLQMTGYMFKNAEYRLSLSETLLGNGLDQLLLSGDEENAKPDTLKGKIRGKLRLRFGGLFSKKSSTETNETVEATSASVAEDDAGIEVDANAYVAELRKEVQQLRNELVISRKEKEEALRKDLLMYIRTLPEKELRELTSTMSQDVLVAMKGLVNAVIAGIGEGQIGPDTVTEQSSEAMAQLCMWQLALGYNLRSLEVREEMKKSLSAGTSDIDADTVQGAFE
ncbi:hypothetical protein MPSEU_000978600 [Mayamaea pseudoterrestris]|nr:hypothetical protein MPSEU_000978600 [Mayamaea pseudoterrestris]